MEASVGHERQLNLQQQALSEIGPISGIGLPETKPTDRCEGSAPKLLN